MTTLASVLAETILVLRSALAAVAVILLVLCSVDWLVRTRRVTPFGPLARFFRRVVHPVVEPVEKQVLRAGGSSASAPWWTLAVIVLAGILFLELLGWILAQVEVASELGRHGGRGMYVLLVSWTFGILEIALLVRVIAMWLRFSTARWWVRWSIALTEPMLRPLRNILPTVGPLDISPMAAWMLLVVLRWIFLGAVPA
ncbi:MAG: YggT family protein [Gemmatimonadaceae bacterium]